MLREVKNHSINHCILTSAISQTHLSMSIALTTMLSGVCSIILPPSVPREFGSVASVVQFSLSARSFSMSCLGNNERSFDDLRVAMKQRNTSPHTNTLYASAKIFLVYESKA